MSLRRVRTIHHHASMTWDQSGSSSARTKGLRPESSGCGGGGRTWRPPEPQGADLEDHLSGKEAGEDKIGGADVAVEIVVQAQLRSVHGEGDRRANDHGEHRHLEEAVADGADTETTEQIILRDAAEVGPAGRRGRAAEMQTRVRGRALQRAATRT